MQLELEKESHNLLEKTRKAVATFSRGTLISPVITRSVVNIIYNRICLFVCICVCHICLKVAFRQPDVLYEYIVEFPTMLTDVVTPPPFL